MALNNVPLSGQSLNETRSPINQNFSLTNAGFLVDHVELNTSGAGKHNKITFAQQTGDQTTAATELALYTKAVSAVPQLFLRRQSDGTAINITTLTGNATQGSISLPNGLIYKWGTGTTSAVGLQQITFTAAFTTVFQVNTNVSVIGGFSTATASLDMYTRVYNYTNALFDVVSMQLNTPRTRSATNYVWFAIGI